MSETFNLSVVDATLPCLIFDKPAAYIALAPAGLSAYAVLDCSIGRRQRCLFDRPNRLHGEPLNALRCIEVASLEQTLFCVSRRILRRCWSTSVDRNKNSGLIDGKKRLIGVL